MGYMKKYSKYIVIILMISMLISLCFVPISVSRFIPFVEGQVKEQLGVNAHIDRLILQIGPSLKLKTPIVHVTYSDGSKFAQFNAVKLYLPWSSIIKKQPRAEYIQAKKVDIRLSSNDSGLNSLLDNIEKNEFKSLPNLKFKNYKFSYLNEDSNDNYILEGHNLSINKIVPQENFEIKTIGEFSINSKKHINYDIHLIPNIKLKKIDSANIFEFVNQIKELNFTSDLIADLKLFHNSEKQLQVSGYVNIDNISVLDEAKKNPKSFIYLTLWGNKASILSNIYTSQHQKIYIEGMINNSKKPIVDLKIKTDEINISDLYKKFKILSNFSWLKAVDSIDGKLNANFTLKGDLNKIKSAGFMKIKDANVIANGVKIDKVSADVDFSNNSINLLNVIGYVNESPIVAKGAINKNIDIELLMNKVELKKLVPSKYFIKDGIISVIVKFTGALGNIKHKENILIEDLKIKNNNLDFSLKLFKLDTNKSSIASVSDIKLDTEYFDTIKIPSINLQIDHDIIKFQPFDLSMDNSKITAKADIINYLNSKFTYTSMIEGFVNTKDIKTLAEYTQRLPINIVMNGNSSLHNINVQTLLESAEIFGEPVLINLNSKFEKNNIKIEDLSLSSASEKFPIDTKNNFKTNKKVCITGSIENIEKPSMKNLRIFIPQQLNLKIKDSNAQIKGDLFLNGDINNPEIIGQLNFQNFINQVFNLSFTNGSLDFNKNNVILNIPQLKLADSLLGMNALISTDVTKKLIIKNINLKSKYMNTDTLLMYKDLPIFNMFPIEILDGKFYIERLLTGLYSKSLYLTAFTSDIKLKDCIIELNNLSSELFNGKLVGSLKYDLDKEDFSSSIMARGISSESILTLLSDKKESISGILDFDSNITGNLLLKDSLNGNIKFNISNGRMTSLGKLEHLLYAQNILADNMLRTSLSVVTKAITLKDTGLFKYLRGDIDVHNGLLKIKSLQSQGPLMALYITGIYNPMSNHASLTILGRLTDEVIAGLGIFGDFSFNKLMIMLTGEEEKYNTIIADIEKIPQLPSRNTKEFRSIINGNIEKPSSVALFNWISYTQKSLKQKEIPMSDVKLPDFIKTLPY